MICPVFVRNDIVLEWNLKTASGYRMLLELPD